MNTITHTKLKKFLVNENHTHIFMHGPRGCGKKTLLYNVLNIKNTHNKLYNKFNYSNFENFFIFDSRDINKNKEDFIKFSKELVKSNINDLRNYIIIKDSPDLQEVVLNFLRRFMEFNYATTVFIFIANSCRGRISAILSRCLFLRIPYPTNQEYEHYIKNECEKRETPSKEYYLTIKNIGLLSDRILLDSLKIEYIDNLNTFIKGVPVDILDYDTFKPKLHAIIKQGYTCTDILLEYIKICNNPNIINIVSEYEHNMKLGFRELIHLEALFYRIHIYCKKFI